MNIAETVQNTVHGIGPPDLADLPFRAVVAGIRDREIFLLHADGRIATWNDGAAEMTGYSARDIVGSHFSRLYTADEQARGHPDRALREAAATGFSRQQTWRLRQDGSRFWADIEITPIHDGAHDGAGTARGFTVLVRDLSFWHAAQAELLESEERFRTMADCAPVLLWMSGLDGRCNFFNDGWLRFTGRSMEQELGSGWAEGVHAEDFQHCMHTYLTAFVARQSFTMEYRLRRADGEYRWLLDQGRPRFSPDGSFQGFIGSCADITEQKRLQQQFRDVVEAAPNSMVMVDGRGRIVLVNAHAENLFGYTRDELVGRLIETLIPERFRDAHAGFRRHFFAAPNQRPMGVGRDLFALRKDGTEFPVEIALNPIDTEAGPMVLSVILDISERRQREEHVRRLNAELEERVAERTAELRSKNAELETFTYSVSHDLRTPLRAINGYAQLLKTDYASRLDSEASRLLDVIRENTRRMSVLIDDLLELSRLGRRALTPGPVDIGGLFLESGALSHDYDSGSRLELKIHGLPMSWGDRSLLQQVATNLLANAVKFSSKREHPVVEVTGVLLEREIIYCVKDNGAGFDMRHYGKLFGVFQRLHQADEFPGTGLGLAIVNRIVAMHGGRVWAEGKVDQGASFYFSLPRRKNPCLT